MKIKKCSVIIPNWNGEHLLPDCLKSLDKQTFKDYEILVVDNNSNDGSIKYIETNFPKYRIINLNRNFGFARAINEGVKISESKYVIFLNNDTKVEKDWLKNLVKCADSHPEVISVNSKILNFYNPKKIDGVGILINEVGQAGSIGYGEVDNGQYEKEEYIFGATGGASLFKKEDFIKLSGFDENYFMYSEEVDFAFRAQFAGLQSIYCPHAIVYHKHKATSKNFPEKVEYWQFRNMYQTIIKDFPINTLKKNYRWLKIILVYLNTVIYQIRNKFFWAPAASTFWLILHLGPLLEKRSRIQKSKIVSDEYLEGFLRIKRITLWGLWK